MSKNRKVHTDWQLFWSKLMQEEGNPLCYVLFTWWNCYIFYICSLISRLFKMIIKKIVNILTIYQPKTFSHYYSNVSQKWGFCVLCCLNLKVNFCIFQRGHNFQCFFFCHKWQFQKQLVQCWARAVDSAMNGASVESFGAIVHRHRSSFFPAADWLRLLCLKTSWKRSLQKKTLFKQKHSSPQKFTRLNVQKQ